MTQPKKKLQLNGIDFYGRPYTGSAESESNDTYHNVHIN